MKCFHKILLNLVNISNNMAFNTQEQEIIRWGASNGKSRQDVEQALTNFRTGIVPQPQEVVPEQPSLGAKLGERAKTFGKEAVTLGTLGANTLDPNTPPELQRLAAIEGGLKAAQAPIKMTGAIGGAIGDVVGAGLEATGLAKPIGQALAPVVESQPVQKAVNLFKSLPQDTQDVLGAILNTANIPLGGVGTGAIKSGVESGVKAVTKTIPEKVASLKGIADTTVQESVKKDVSNLLSATRGISNKAKLAEQKGVNLNEILSDPQVFKGIKVENAKINPDEAINVVDNRITSLMDAKQKLLPEVDRLVPKQSKEVLRKKAYADIKGKFTPADEADIKKSIDTQIDALPNELSVSEIDAFRAKARASARDAKGLQKRSSEYSALENASRDTVFDITDKLPVANSQDYKALNDYIKQMIETKSFLDSTLRNQVVKGGRLRNYAMRAVGAVAGAQGGVLGSLAGSEIGSVVADIITNNQLGSSIKMNLIKNITDDPAILKQAEDLLGSVQQAELLGLPAPSGKVGATGKEVINALPSRAERSVGFPQLNPNMSLQNTANKTIKRNVIQANSTTNTVKGKGIRGMVNPSELLNMLTPKQKELFNAGTKEEQKKALEYLKLKRDLETKDAIIAPKKKVVSSLEQEAKKYKSAEEFVKAQGVQAFHGTPEKFDKFDISKNGKSTDSGMFGKGFYFTNDIKEAKTYSTRNGKTGEVKDVILNLKNPLVLNSKNDIPKINVPMDTIEQMRNADKNYSEAFTKYLKDNGFDGVIDKISGNKIQYVVLDNTQIKTKKELIDIWNKNKK